MGKKLRRTILEFIASIPDSKLWGGFPSSTKLIWSDDNCRLDMQGVTSGEPRCYNLQVQMNKEGTFTSARRAGRKGASVAKVLVPIEAPYTAAEIREMLKVCADEFGDESEQF